MAAALANCKSRFCRGVQWVPDAEMRCHGLKGGIGSASRLVELDGKSYTIRGTGALNHATFTIVAGTPIHELLEALHPAP